MKVTISIRPAQGFALVELLVAMVLGLILMTGVISVFISTKQGYAQQDASGQMQENARFALEMITRETRMAGYGGCSAATNVANTVEYKPGVAPGVATSFSDGLTGYEGDATNSTFPAWLSALASPNTDAITIHTIDNSDTYIVNTHNPMSATIRFTTSNSTLQTGDIILIVDADCSNMAIFANTGPANPTNNANRSNHNTGNINTSTPGVSYGYDNCTVQLKGNFDCSDKSGAQSQAYSPGSSVYSIDSFTYYVGPSAVDPAILSLYRRNVKDVSEEMVEGVTDLEIFYGLKTGNNVQYLKANSIAANRWVDVQSVRFIVTVRSLTLINGQPVSKNFTSTVRIRNRS